MIVVLRWSASPKIGGGHVALRIRLAEAFAADGHQPLFAVSDQTLDSAPSLRVSGDNFSFTSRPVAAETHLPPASRVVGNATDDPHKRQLRADTYVATAAKP
jgi:hypothetical protein